MIAIKKVASPARSAWVFIALALAFGLISGCASGPARNPTDPWEPMNRGVSKFNETLDDAVFRPVAIGYRDLTPKIVRAGIGNFFDNLGDAWSALNGVLQLRPQIAIDNFVRFGVNTTLGLGGFIDVADEMGIERHQEDFGKTLGRWGVPSGPYLVLPILGPSTLRDGLATTLNGKGDLVRQQNHVPTRNGLYVTRAIDTRAYLLRLDSFLNDAALDKYSFTRDAYLQKRRAEIYRPGQEDEERPPRSEDKDDAKPSRP